jgi:hypothetical protein
MGVILGGLGRLQPPHFEVEAWEGAKNRWDGKGNAEDNPHFSTQDYATGHLYHLVHLGDRIADVGSSEASFIAMIEDTAKIGVISIENFNFKTYDLDHVTALNQQLPLKW